MQSLTSFDVRTVSPTQRSKQITNLFPTQHRICNKVVWEAAVKPRFSRSVVKRPNTVRGHKKNMSIKRRQNNITTMKKLLIIAIKNCRNFVVFFRRQSSRLNSAAGLCLGQSRDETLNGCHDRAERVDETIQFRRYKQQRSPHVTGSDETIEIETFVCRKHHEEFVKMCG